MQSRGKARSAPAPTPPIVDTPLVSAPEVAPARRRLWNPRQFFQTYWPFLTCLLVGMLLRYWDLGDKPLHHDESIHAQLSMNLMRDLQHWGDCANLTRICYKYDPLTHGPFQFHWMAFWYRLAQGFGVPGEGVNTATARLGAALLGSLTLLLPALLCRQLGYRTALTASVIMTLSPSLVYFSRFAREDSYFAFFTFLMIVSVARYMRLRKPRWLVFAALGFILAFATKEAAYLNIGLFVAFTLGVLAWELDQRRLKRIEEQMIVELKIPPLHKCLPLTFLGFVVFGGGGGLIALLMLKNISVWMNSSGDSGQEANQWIMGVKASTQALFPWIGLILAVLTVLMLLPERYRRPVFGWFPAFRARFDPELQPIWSRILSTPWLSWMYALLGLVIPFVLLYTVLFTNYPNGLGDGVWQGLYYWLQQQHLARGEQPWYYYLLLIPLYEPLVVLFGIAGVIWSIRHPSYFRIFLVYWFFGSLFIYSWAGEKMPWLMIHMVIPLTLLASIALVQLAEQAVAIWRVMRSTQYGPYSWNRKRKDAGISDLPRVRTVAKVVVLAGLAIFLAMPTLWNMFQVSYVHAADAPQEMMVYVQTTRDVDLAMKKIEALDQRLFQGKKLLNIGVSQDARWPLIWYLREYTRVCYTFPDCTSPFQAQDAHIALVSGAQMTPSKEKFVTTNQFALKEYKLRTWWDEGYKYPICALDAKKNCTGNYYWGPGIHLWLCYGDTPPKGAGFDAGCAANNIWRWWWERKPIGSATGGFAMAVMVRKDLGLEP